jgi:Mrr restriction endonuclease-like protein/SeqA-like protein
MPVVKVDEEVYDWLRGQVKDFGETPNTVLRRVSGLDRGERPQKPKRLPPGLLLPQGEYWVPILETLVDAGGSLPTAQVRAKVGEVLRDRLRPEDFEKNNTGGVKWKNRVAWVRARMVKRGVLKAGSPRGVWEITQEGREWLRFQRESAKAAK